jgi:lipoprotein-anchoring transpeptidase ErfK/SrfK
MFERPAWKNPFTGDVIPGGDPDNPLGKYWIGFWTNGKDWSGFHGTPNRDSVGTAASHGCIRMYNEDIAELFAQVSPATVVQVVH